MTNEANVSTSLETLYTVQSSTTTVLLGIMLSNTSSSTVKASVQIVSTSAVGSLSLQIDFTGTLTAPSTLTASVGSLDPTQEIVGLTGLGVTSSVGQSHRRT